MNALTEWEVSQRFAGSLGHELLAALLGGLLGHSQALDSRTTTLPLDHGVLLEQS